MRRRNTIRIVMLAMVLAGAFLVFSSAHSADKRTQKKACKESMEQCCKKSTGGGKTVLENLSQHFFSSI